MKLNGLHAVIEALTHNETGTLYILKHHRDLEKINFLAKKNNCTVVFLSKSELDNKGGRQGVLFETTVSGQISNSSYKRISEANQNSTQVKNLDVWLNQQQDKPLCVLILDHILDPQNLGAIVRSATLLNVSLMILPERRMAPENELAGRSAAGGMSIMPRYYTSNLSQAVELLKANDFWIYALDMDGEYIHNTTFPSRVAFVLGGENKGVSLLLKNNCDAVLSLANNEKLESFNVSVSAALCCYEYYRQLVIKKQKTK